ncbi:CRISPR-associated endonuclease Cas3'' [Acinetobacter sp. VNH17]|uniref:CRISPR-associated endonuclease Cas3 n=1 Tax=Acinetobacter thutiue TaxID=2998078 RepID=A0ABT7WQ21_9GAMM|nr:CRISPR-associated endonuclease Cas3'' [Acinetobacter thutiue]MCY6412653.1 CRISPR-associated endonuclease Cas3'' [Acinetobacter thutiue]MDN0014760.1 CRISPR-associated endonuclease Cas3'' [Acinetobacter thutiue]
MIVTFISQCEKKALARTRRVLDAFADRIGDNTWQTVITEEGLVAVKKLLRKTVTKNTAVSCHWIRCRRRSELMWIVGNRNKFNEQGIVPVNSTQKEVFMDVMTMKAKKDEFYANTRLQPLAEHSFAIGYLAQQLFKKIVDNDEYENLSKVAFLAGCLHDLGKLDPHFQDWVKKGKQKDPEEDGQHIDVKFTFDKHPRHNEISLLIFNLLESQCKNLNNRQKESIQHVLYWHHAKPYRQNDDFTSSYKAYEYLIKNISAEKFSILVINSTNVIKRINGIAKHFDAIELIEQNLPWNEENLNTLIENFEYSFKSRNFPEFKSYASTDSIDVLTGKIQINAQHNLLRACVISADRIVSKQTAQDLMDYIAEKRLDELLDDQEILSNLAEHLKNVEYKFPDSERTQKQNQVAQELADLRDIAVLAGPAGCGKTKIALEWARLKDAKKIIWVCPRVQVCQGIFEELTQDYLPDAKVEILTGEFKYINEGGKIKNEPEPFSGDVVVTTIDQILGSIVTHTNVNSLLPFIDAYVVFDEYHEYIGMEIFNLLFAELITNKNMRKRCEKNTLLVSATPHYYYLENILNVHKDDVIEMSSFNQSQYQIDFVDYDESVIEGNPFYKTYSDQTFIISNTAQTAQLGFIYQKNQENSVLFHSKYKRSDKKIWFDEVFDSFKKDGSQKYDVLRSGPIVQASLNITSKHMLSEMTSPENMLQRMGRLDRFGESRDVNILQIAITENVKNGSCKGSLAYFLNQLNSLQTTKAWYDFLQDRLNGKVFKIAELYKLYSEFYKQQMQLGDRSAVMQDMNKALKKSIDLMNKKVTEPTKVIKPKMAERKSKISKNSLRGDSRFVQLAVLNLNDFKQPIFENRYAYTPPLDDTTEYDNLTESLNIIKDLGLINFIAQKHGNVDSTHPVKGIPEKKQQARCAVLESYARDADFPLYLSYIEDDLNKVGGTGVRHSEAIYYAITDQQPIGSISLDKLKFLTTTHEEK